jgi:MSHA biogenesis protein MshO
MKHARAAGMTLIELVVVITLAGICVTFMSMFIVQPIEAYTAETQRAALTDTADGALRMLSRDLRAALPNSLRVASSGSVVALEFLATVDGARYRDNGPFTDPTQSLNFTTAATAFATTVPFSQVTLPFTSSSDYFVIYNVGVPGANAYAMSNVLTPVITPVGTTITIRAGSSTNAQLVTMSPGFQFAWGSPGKRIYLISGPVSYLCDTASGTLIRYSGYPIASTQLTSAASLVAAGASTGQVAANVGACTFSYTSGTATRVGMATLILRLVNGTQQVQLVHQVHLVNAP